MPRLIEEARSDRVALLKLSISHPSAHVRELAEPTHSALSRSLSSARMFLDDLVRSKSSPEMKNRAVNDHAEATECVERLVEAIRAA